MSKGAQGGRWPRIKPQPPVFLEAQPQDDDDRSEVVTVHLFDVRLPATHNVLCADCSQPIPAGARMAQLSDNTYLCPECTP